MACHARTCTKSFLLVVTTLLVIFGLLVVCAGLSSVAFLQQHLYEKADPLPSQSPPPIVLIIGLIIFAIAFIGCLGTLTGKNFFLQVFALLLVVLMVLEISSVGVVFAFSSKVSSGLQNCKLKLCVFPQYGQDMKESVHIVIVRYNVSDPASAYNRFVDEIQSESQCCGAVSAQDWQANAAFANNVQLPGSCCAPSQTGECRLDSLEVYNQGCGFPLTFEMNKSLEILFWVTIGVCAAQALLIILTCSIIGERQALKDMK